MMPFMYYLLAVPVLAALGVLGHVARGLFNVFPDRGYTSTPRTHYSLTDDFLSGNYSYTDHLVGTEYDDNGYYDLHSLKNLRISVQLHLAGGFAILLLAPGAGPLFRQGVDISALWLWDLFLYRLANLSVI